MFFLQKFLLEKKVKKTMVLFGIASKGSSEQNWFCSQFPFKKEKKNSEQNWFCSEFRFQKRQKNLNIPFEKSRKILNRIDFVQKFAFKKNRKILNKIDFKTVSFQTLSFQTLHFRTQVQPIFCLNVWKEILVASFCKKFVSQPLLSPMLD